MIWYACWLEMRARVMVAAVWAALGSAVCGFAYYSASRRYAATGTLDGNFGQLEDILRQVGAAAFFGPASFALFLPIATMLMALVSSGLKEKGGIASPLAWGSPPVSRLRMMAWRSVAGALMLALTTAVFSAACLLVLTVLGAPLLFWNFAYMTAVVVAWVLPAWQLAALAKLYFEEMWAQVAVFLVLVRSANSLPGPGLKFQKALLTGNAWPYALAGLVLASLTLPLLFWLGRRKEV